jgi:transcription elongation GreA/GreB family factor
MKKEEAYRALLAQLQERVVELQQAWSELLESNQQEGKSSAGDKHETAGAMVHLEMEKLAKQLEEGRRQLSEVEKYNPDRMTESSQVQMGSLVQTTKGWYYLITSLGKISLNGETCFVLSGASPLGRLMMEKRVGDEIVRDGKEVRIVGVF